MTYDTLLNGIAEKTGLQVEDIRSMMDALPDVLSEAEEGEQTRTPLGVFTMKLRAEKNVRLPDGTWTKAECERQVRLKPGKRLRKTC